MITTHQAEALVREHAIPWKQARIPLNQAHGHYLAESLLADRDGPPFNRVAMDGISILFSEFDAGEPIFKCVGMQAAGDPQKKREGQQTCLEAMTGAVLPENCDLVIPFEHCEKVDDHHYRIMDSIEPKAWLNIHTQACDFSTGKELISPKHKIRAAEIAVLASLGVTDPLVFVPPSIALITTGSELVDVHETPLAHQIRKSNIHAAAANLKSQGFSNLTTYHIQDDLEQTTKGLEKCLEQHDVLILSGGVSKGKLDFVPEALKNLGVEKVFHRIAQKPGKPMWFGKKGNQCVYALPGNPISLLVCLTRYVIPALLEHVSEKPKTMFHLPLAETFKPKGKLNLLSPVTLIDDPAFGLTAQKVSNHGSGDYASLTLSSGFVELAAREEAYEKGEFVPYYPWESN